MATYIETTVSDVQKVLELLQAQHGKFALAMLYSRDEPSETGWNLIVAAPWADRLSKADATGIVVDALSVHLGMENKRAISRVTVLPVREDFVREMTSFFQVASPGAAHPVHNVSAAGIPIGAGYVFYSQHV